MSAYIVEDKVINAVVNYIRTDADGSWVRAQVIKAGYVLTDKTLSGYIKLAQDLRDLNVAAVNARYKENTKEMPFIFHRISGMDLIPVLKALSCLLYQCSEGDVPEAPLFKLMQQIQHAWAMRVVQKLPAWDKAAWGYDEPERISLTDMMG